MSTEISDCSGRARSHLASLRRDASNESPSTRRLLVCQSATRGRASSFLTQSNASTWPSSKRSSRLATLPAPQTPSRAPKLQSALSSTRLPAMPSNSPPAGRPWQRQLVKLQAPRKALIIMPESPPLTPRREKRVPSSTQLLTSPLRAKLRKRSPSTYSASSLPDTSLLPKPQQRKSVQKPSVAQEPPSLLNCACYVPKHILLMTPHSKSSMPKVPPLDLPLLSPSPLARQQSPEDVSSDRMAHRPAAEDLFWESLPLEHRRGLAPISARSSSRFPLSSLSTERINSSMEKHDEEQTSSHRSHTSSQGSVMLENIEELPVEIGSETFQCKEASAFSFDFQQPAPSQSPPSTVQDSAVFLFDDSTILAYQGENVYDTNSGEKSTSRTRSGGHAHGTEQVPSGCDDCPARIWDSFEEEFCDDVPATPAVDPLTLVPFAIAVHILDLLDPTSRQRCQSVCRHWRKVARQVWSNRIRRQLSLGCVTVVDAEGAVKHLNKHYRSYVAITVPDLLPGTTPPARKPKLTFVVPYPPEAVPPRYSPFSFDPKEPVDLSAKRAWIDRPGQYCAVDAEVPFAPRQDHLIKFGTSSNAYETPAQRLEMAEVQNIYCDSCSVSLFFKPETSKAIVGACIGDNRLAITCTSKRIRFVDVESGETFGRTMPHLNGILCVVASKEHNLIFSGSRDLSIRSWDARTGERDRDFWGHIEAVLCIDVNGEHLVSGSKDCTVKVWKVKGRLALHTYRHQRPVTAVKFLADGTIVSGCEDGRVYHWQIGQHRRPLRILFSHTAVVNSIDSDKWHFASASSDGFVIVWSSKEFHSKPVALMQHMRPVTVVIITFLKILTASEDGKVRLWDMLTGDLLRLFRPDTDVRPPITALFTAGRKAIYACSKHGVIVFKFRRGDDAVNCHEKYSKRWEGRLEVKVTLERQINFKSFDFKLTHESQTRPLSAKHKRPKTTARDIMDIGRPEGWKRKLKCAKDDNAMGNGYRPHSDMAKRSEPSREKKKSVPPFKFANMEYCVLKHREKVALQKEIDRERKVVNADLMRNLKSVKLSDITRSRGRPSRTSEHGAIAGHVRSSAAVNGTSGHG